MTPANHVPVVTVGPDLMLQHPVELLFGNRQPLPVCAVNHHDDEVGAGVVGAPSLSQGLLSSYVPHDKVKVLPSYLWWLHK